jgi:hypothetical protein
MPQQPAAESSPGRRRRPEPEPEPRPRDERAYAKLMAEAYQACAADDLAFAEETFPILKEALRD